MENRSRQKWSGTIKVKNSGTFGVQVTLDKDSQANDTISLLSFLNSPDLTVNNVVPLRLIKDLCRESDHLITEITLNDSKYLNWSKFAKFLYSNKQAAILQSPKRLTDLIILTNALRENWTLEKSELNTAIYIKHMVPADYIPVTTTTTTTTTAYNSLLDSRLNAPWKAVVHLLKFPDELSALIKRKDIEFQVVGTSGLAQMLRDAIKSSEMISATSTFPTIDRSSSSLSSSSLALSSSLPSSPLTLSLNEAKTIVMVDRSDNRLYRTSWKHERSAKDTMMFQFGSSGPKDPITPPSVVYPKNTGGFVTTDSRNILMNPDILDKMVDYATKKNRSMLGTWKPILHTEIFTHIMRSGTGTAAQNAISRILLWLSSKDIDILENWGETIDDTKWKTATLDWFDTIVRTHSSEHEAFYFVDDGSSSSNWHHYYPAIDFINSNALILQ